MVWIGVDVGQKRSGLALSESGVLSRPLGLLAGSLDEQINELLGHIEDTKAAVVVLGRADRDDPTHPSRVFADKLARALARLTNPPQLVWVDETLSSKEAEQLTGRTANQPGQSDMIAAQLLLEQYFRESEDAHAK